MSQRILMIEDDHRLAAMVSSYLAQNGFAVQLCETAQEGLAQLQGAFGRGTGAAVAAAPSAVPSAVAGAAPFALVLLDLMLPDADGLEVCRRIRSLPAPLDTTPIVMLTAKGDPMDRVVGLELGADDYLGKPFEPRELLARLRAVLRRPPIATPSAPNRFHDAPTRVLRFGRMEIDVDARALRIDGQLRSVTGYQFDLLVAMAERAGRVLSREQLLDTVKGEPLDAFDRSIDVHVGRLRAIIEDDPKQPRRILTVRGAGYVFAKVQDV